MVQERLYWTAKAFLFLIGIIFRIVVPINARSMAVAVVTMIILMTMVVMVILVLVFLMVLMMIVIMSMMVFIVIWIVVIRTEFTSDMGIIAGSGF